MPRSEAGRSKQGKKSQDRCAHQRVVDYEVSDEGERTGNLICCECGAIFLEENNCPNSVDSN